MPRHRRDARRTIGTPRNHVKNSRPRAAAARGNGANRMDNPPPLPTQTEPLRYATASTGIEIDRRSLDRAMTNADRVVSVVELLVAVASRGVKLAPPDEPMTLDPIEPAAS